MDVCITATTLALLAVLSAHRIADRNSGGSRNHGARRQSNGEAHEAQGDPRRRRALAVLLQHEKRGVDGKYLMVMFSASVAPKLSISLLVNYIISGGGA